MLATVLITPVDTEMAGEIAVRMLKNSDSIVANVLVYEQVCLAEFFKIPINLTANLLIYRVTCSFCALD
jgi:hypothetical protein